MTEHPIIGFRANEFVDLAKLGHVQATYGRAPWPGPDGAIEATRGALEQIESHSEIQAALFLVKSGPDGRLFPIGQALQLVEDTFQEAKPVLLGMYIDDEADTVEVVIFASRQQHEKA